MKMKDFHCDLFELSFDFPQEDFDKAAFLEEIGVADEAEYVDEDGDLVLHVSLVSQEETPEHHGHLRLIIFANGEGNVDLDFHRHGHKTLPKKSPYLEDSAKWLGRFFKKESFPAQIDASYQFDETFAPVIPLPFPLVASSKALSGLKVSGLSLEFPEDYPLDSVIVQTTREAGPYLFIDEALSEFTFKDFDLFQELAKLKSSVVDALIRESTDVNSREAKKV